MQKVLSRLKLPFFFALTILLLWNISAVTDGVKNALAICAFSIIPSLFVFLVLSDIITSLLLSEGSMNVPPKWIVFLLGSLCGFPVGAVVCDRLYKSGTLSEQEAERLLPLCNNTSPAFVMGAVGTAMLDDIKLGLLLFFAQLISALILFLPIHVHKHKVRVNAAASSFSNQFFSAIEKAVGSILKICALICLFSALLAVLRCYCSETAYVFLAALSEIGNGSASVCKLFTTSPAFSIMLCGFVCGWSGLCVHFQIFLSLKSIKVKKIHFWSCKFFQGILSAIFSLAGYKLFFCS